MPMTSGTRLGPYEIVAPLGAGGMGEVYRARDTRLGRDVAIKVLPQHLSASAEVHARFEREAKTVSSLNHPHICTLHDIGREGDTDYLVMELVEGETLAQRLAKGALPTTEVLRLGAQIADALDRAHRAGVVHRDLKPGNVMLTKSGAKLMDFGLARATGLGGPAGGSGITQAALTQSPTIAQPLTAEGTIVGTFQYMAPEQLEGREADVRSDVWALGCVLYEMTTGKRAFEGRSQASLITSIMGSEPNPISQVSPMAPTALERLVQACLAKDPADRLQSAHDIKLQLSWIAAGGSQTGAPAPVKAAGRRRPWPLVAAVASIAAVAAIALLATRTRSAVPHGALGRFSIGSSENATLAADGAQARISPDGRTLAFVAASATGTVSFWVRPLDSLVARPLTGTEDGSLPFWSPDGRYLAYFGNGKLTKTLVAGGTPTAICNAGDGRGATWGRGGVIVFAPESAGPLYRAGESGGEISQVTALDGARQETGHRWPCFLPDGKHFLFVTLPAKQGNFDVFVGSIDSKERKLLFTASSAPIYAEPGYLIYLRDNTLVAHRFDAGHLATTGDPVSLGETPAPSSWTGAPVVSASNDGVLARWGVGLPNTVLQWYDRTGKPVGNIPVPAGRYEQVRLSSDGKRLAMVRRSSVSATDIWLLELDRPVPSRFTFGPSNNYQVTWSPDGSRIAFSSDRFGPDDIFVKSTNGATEETVVLKGGALFKEPSSWSSDGKTIVFDQPDPKTGWDIVLLPVDGERTPVPFLRTPFTERQGNVSPDGRWLAYYSDEPGRLELFVQSFPVPGAKYQVSSGGASNTATRWTRRGNELMFVAADGLTVMAADVTTGTSFRAGAPRELFKLRPDVAGFDFAPDGERILIAAPAGRPQPSSITLDMNWPAEIDR